MKILADKLKPFSTEIAPEYQQLIADLKSDGDVAKFVSGLDTMTEWCSNFGKTEMGRWMDVLNDCDAILESATEEDEQGSLAVDRDDALEGPVVSVLRFTSLLFENTFSRSIYASIERLIKLVESRTVSVVVHALRLMMVISKSSRFISQHISSETRNRIYTKLMAILETWSGRLRTIPIREFCSENYTISPSILNIQLRPDVPCYTVNLNKSLADSMSEMNALYQEQATPLDEGEKALAHYRLRFAYCTKNHSERFYLVMSRLIATSVFFYSRCLIAEEWRLNSLSNDAYIEYCCGILRLETSKYQSLADAVKTEALKTLASVVFLEKAKKIQLIVDNLELKIYHGFLPTQLRNCIDSLRAGRLESSAANSDCSISFVTALFSLIYHLAGFEYAGDALNRCSMTSVLLGVVKNYALSEQHISFVTRSVRIIDILTGRDITEFNANDGTDGVIRRFTHEIAQSKEHMKKARELGTPMLCNQQRSALMKSLLNFLKRAVLDVHLGPQMRRIMETELPASLVHIVDNPHYYGASLLHCTVTLTTNFIYQEPAQLTLLQNKGLTDAIMSLIFNEKFPISRDLICALPNVCSAMCLNARGLEEMKTYKGQKPLERMFRIIFSNKFLLSMRKRKTEIIETAHTLGTSFDELIRHHPTLRKEMMGTMALIIDDWLAFESNCAKEGKKCQISWGVGRSVIEEDSSSLLPLGDYLAMIGIMLETMLTNRGVHDNIQVANESGIALKLIKLITDAPQPNPIMLQSNNLHALANLLRYVMAHVSKVDDAFAHLVKSAVHELNSYQRCDTAEDAASSDRLCQLTRLCALVSILNSLLKSSLHSQSTYEMRPFMLQYFATDPTAQSFIGALFDAYKVIGTDRLVISCASQQQNQQQTTSQILEDTTKVRELLLDDEQSREQQNTPMEVDSTYTLRTQTTMPSASIFVNSTQDEQEENSIATTSHSATVATTTTSSDALTSRPQQHITERSAHSVAIRCMKQIAELMTYMGKAFCTVSFPRMRRTVGTGASMDQTTMRKHSQQITALLFIGLHRLLKADDTLKTEDKASLGASHIHQALSTLKKLLIDESQNLALLLPNFYKSGCHRIFFAMVDECLRPSITKLEFNLTVQAWLSITQRLTSVHLLNSITKSSKNNGLQKPFVEGFEPKHYLATCQKDAFTALVNMFKDLAESFEQQQQQKQTAYPSTSTAATEDERAKEEEQFKLLERVLDSMKYLVQGMMDLLQLTEDRPEQAPEIPVSEIDPKKIEQLVEMGFSQSDAVDALMQHTSVPEAAEYLVSLMERTSAAAHNAIAAHSPDPTAALAATTVAADVVAAATAEVVVGESPSCEKPDDSTTSPPALDLKPLNREEFQEKVQFLCKEVVGVCLRLVRRSRSVLVGLSELLAVFVDDPIARCWVDGEFIGRLIMELDRHLDRLTAGRAATGVVSDEEEEDLDEELVEQLSSLLQLFCQLWRHFPHQRIYKRLEQQEGNTSAPMMTSTNSIDDSKQPK